MKLTIEVPEGKKAVWKDNQIIFEDIELPNTWKEFCKSYPIKRGEYFVDSSSQILAPAWAARKVYATQNVLPSYPLLSLYRSNRYELIRENTL